jgi:hypothetical protein
VTTFARMTQGCFRILYYKSTANKILALLRGFMSKTNRTTQFLDLHLGSNFHSAMLGYEKAPLISTSKKQQVLVIGNNNAFADGIIHLLRHQSNLNTSYAKYLDEVCMLRDVTQDRPDVVVLVLSRAMNLEIIVGLLMSTRALAHLRLIILSMDTNKIEIYEMENTANEVKSTNINMVEVNDFLAAINKNWKGIATIQ